ncbi:zymogen granule membrane protein 16-like [Notamacropus eugenii]|uniref:zymogen granule membrane protein 16-like n=1 Tax=Notamacropus eugenii TaxID=9315 RepID=UPI003B66C4F5
MLFLFLTLVLLGASANGLQQQSQGQGIAEGCSHFVLTKEGQKITGIRVQVGTSGYLTSIQVQHGTTWSPRHGSLQGTLQEVILNTDESIVQVTGSNGKTHCLQQLTFVTDKGRKLEFGQVGPNHFNALPQTVGDALSSIFGRYDSACLTGLTFEWISGPKDVKAVKKQSSKGK